MRIFAYILSALMCSGLCAQSTFNIVYNRSVDEGWPDLGGGLGHAVHVTDSGYRVYGFQVSQNTYSKPFVGDFDPQGQFKTNSELFSSVVAHGEFGESGCVADLSTPSIAFVTEWEDVYAETKTLLVKIGSDGDTVNSTLVQDTGAIAIKQSIRTSYGRAVGVGFWWNIYLDSSEYASMLVCDTSGQIQDMYTYGLGYILKVEEYIDGGYVLLGGNHIDADNRGLIIRVDSLGNEIWRKHHGGWGGKGSLHVYENGDILVATNYRPPGQPFDDQSSRLIKYNAQGGMIFQEDFLTSKRSIPMDIEVLNSGDIVILGNYTNLLLAPPIYKAYIVKLDSIGQLKWYRIHEHFHDYLGAHVVYDMALADDGGFVVVGDARADTTTNYSGLQHTWLFKTDSMGCIVPGCQFVGIEEEEQKELNVYPNPFNNSFRIVLGPQDRVASVILYDALGREQQISFEINNNSVQAALPKGLYILEVFFEDGSRRKKRMMKE